MLIASRSYRSSSVMSNQSPTRDVTRASKPPSSNQSERTRQRSERALSRAGTQQFYGWRLMNRPLRAQPMRAELDGDVCIWRGRSSRLTLGVLEVTGALFGCMTSEANYFFDRHRGLARRIDARKHVSSHLVHR